MLYKTMNKRIKKILVQEHVSFEIVKKDIAKIELKLDKVKDRSERNKLLIEWKHLTENYNDLKYKNF